MPKKLNMFHHAQAVLFDLDGTLIDSAPDLGAAVDKMRVDRGLPSFPLEHYRHMAGAGARGMLGIAFGMRPEHPEFEAMKEEFFVNYENCMTERTRIFDGVVDMIERLVALGLPWGVVTNKSSRFTDPLTSAMPLFATAKAIVSGNTTPHAKPHPEPLFEAARVWPSIRHTAFMWATTSVTSWRVWPQAWARWLPLMVIWGKRRIFRAGMPTCT
jgi:N-acetyl-D-muramate 6-phosphate phosphatase